jgi:glutamate-ammonia-ligase adenylyltransferase
MDPGPNEGRIDEFIGALPDPKGARAFLERLKSSQPRRARELTPLLAHLLTLAAHSSFLAEAMLSCPDDIDWLEGQLGRLDQSKSTEQLGEELARLSARLSASPQTKLARFKNRELLRIYLRDCTGRATLSEVTEELSNLADVILCEALLVAQSEMINRHGQPNSLDPRGRAAPAEFAIISLGKLGCRELNYSSDIDLVFLYSGRGQTSKGMDNKEFFTKLAERILQLINGRIYRVDLRLRPYGGGGDLVCELERAANYYASKAHALERQALMRARTSAGSPHLCARLLELVRDALFSAGALAQLKLLREKLDSRIPPGPGFNVKLGRGAIREIELIAQALQLIYGRSSPWLRSAQMLIVLARLAERGCLLEMERAKLSAAYTFLRTVEHRLQMEYGAQTHTIPADPERLARLARRCGYGGADPTASFLEDLRTHTSSVRAIYNRIFADIERPKAEAETDHTRRDMVRAARSMALLSSNHTYGELVRIISSALPLAFNPHRSLRGLISWAESLAARALDGAILDEGDLARLTVRLLKALSSQHLAEILMLRPEFALSIEEPRGFGPRTKAEFVTELRCAMDQRASRLDALRRARYCALLNVGYGDISALCQAAPRRSLAQLRANNLEQTALAEAALELVSEEILYQLGRPRLAVMGLGRLGHAGMDYGSDLDIIVVHEESSAGEDLCARFTAELAKALSSITREGSLYQVDLRLRPEGKNGPLAHRLDRMLDYIKNRASAWELSAYLKMRPVAADAQLGPRACAAICEAIFQAASKRPNLKSELDSIRSRLEREKRKPHQPDIKWGPGGMTDVYFITRYVQLRDRAYFPPERGTLALILHLGELGLLDPSSAATLYKGYAFLRSLDHWMRLLLNRTNSLLPASEQLLKELARAMGLDSASKLEELRSEHASRIRHAYDQILK